MAATAPSRIAGALALQEEHVWTGWAPNAEAAVKAAVGRRKKFVVTMCFPHFFRPDGEGGVQGKFEVRYQANS